MVNPRGRFNLALACGCVFVATTVWLSSGTLAPYAITVEHPKVLPPCGYLANPDHPHFEATFVMLDGQPREQWAFSTMLRRILFPILAYPAMKALGFLAGGFVTSLLIQVFTLAGFAIYVRRTMGEAAGLAAIALLATYPGTYYWAGLPYPHVMIVPASIGATVILREIDRAISLRRIVCLSIALGMLLLSYDLAPFFILPPLIILIRKRFAWAVTATTVALLPMAMVAGLLRYMARIELYNDNTAPYFIILRRYFDHDVTFGAWMKHIAVGPREFVKTYLWSNFVFIPALFLVVGVLHVLTRRTRARRAEFWILISGLALFLFNNCAPPYRGWQFHGEGVSRIYQPLIGAMLLIIIRAVDHAAQSTQPIAQASSRGRKPAGFLVALIGITALLNASIALGPIIQSPLAAWTYHKFYQHAPAPQMLQNLATYGRRPLGICNRPKPSKLKKPKPTPTPASAPSALSSAAALCRDG